MGSPIDDGLRGGHSARMSFTEKPDLRGADQPLLHAKCFYSACRSLGPRCGPSGSRRCLPHVGLRHTDGCLWQRKI